MVLSLNLNTVSLDFVLIFVFYGHLKIKMGSQVTIIFTNIRFFVTNILNMNIMLARE